MRNKMVRVLLILRIVLWVIATVATFYWISWSFQLYNRGIFDVYEYSDYLRPVLAKGLLIAFMSICLSFLLRSISDRLKRK